LPEFPLADFPLYKSKNKKQFSQVRRTFLCVQQVAPPRKVDNMSSGVSQLSALQKQEQKTVLPSQTHFSLRPTGGTTTEGG